MSSNENTETEASASSSSRPSTVWNPGLDSHSPKNGNNFPPNSSSLPTILPNPPFPFALLAAAHLQQHQHRFQQNPAKMSAPPPSTSSFPTPQNPFKILPIRLPPPLFPFILPPPQIPPIPQISPNFGQMAAAFMAAAVHQQQMQIMETNGGNGNKGKNGKKKNERSRRPIAENDQQKGEMNKLKEAASKGNNNKRKGQRQQMPSGHKEESDREGLEGPSTAQKRRREEDRGPNPIVELVLNEKPAAVNFNTCAICGISFRLTSELVQHFRLNHRQSRYDRHQKTSIAEAQMREKFSNKKEEEGIGNQRGTMHE